MDSGWYGVFNGSTLNFLAIYLTRLGASNGQIGLFNAAPALVNALFTLSAGRRMQPYRVEKVAFWSSVAQRIFLLAFILLPIFLTPEAEVWAAILITFIMSIPGTYLAVAMPALVAEAVPMEWRSYIAGTRNAMLSIVTIATALICGLILMRLPFPHGYQVVFAIGFLGSAMSSLHLFFIHPPGRASSPSPGPDISQPEPVPSTIKQPQQGTNPKQSLMDTSLRSRLALLGGRFGRVLLLLFSINLAIYLVIPVIQLFQVNGLHLTDRTIGFGTGVFFFSSFAASMQIRRIARKWSYRNVTGAGVIGLAIFPSLVSIWGNPVTFVLLQAFAGFSWALINSSLFNYLYERIPPGNMPEYLAWYNLTLNMAILLGSLLGAAVASAIGLASALFMLAMLRIISGICLLMWG